MKIAVLGCGAMGSIYAALLASAGHEVTAIDTNAEHMTAINGSGLRVSGASGDRTVSIRACTTPPAESFDLVIIAVKGAFVAAAADSATSMMAEHTRILTIQNGLGSADEVAERLGSDRLIVGVAQGFGASLPAAGHAHHNDMKAIRMGSYAGLPHSETQRIASAWNEAGFDAGAVTDILSMQWNKLICNVAYSALAALTGKTVGEIMIDEHVGEVSRMAATEAWQIAHALNIELESDDPAQYVKDFAARMPDAKPSVLLDIEAGRPSEVGMINGAVPVQAGKIGLTAPINDTLTRLVLDLEARNHRT